MRSVSIAHAKAHFEELIERVVAGEAVEIVRQGQRIAVVSPAANIREKFDAAKLRAITDGMTRQEQSAGDFIRAMRDSDRY